MMITEYEGKMDAECILLCDAINKLPGLKTIDSCCGHNKYPFVIFFIAEDLKDLPKLLYWFNSCHCGFVGWQVLVTTDCARSPVHFCIEGKIGAFDEANKIGLLIEQAQKGKGYGKEEKMATPQKIL